VRALKFALTIVRLSGSLIDANDDNVASGKFGLVQPVPPDGVDHALARTYVDACTIDQEVLVWSPLKQILPAPHDLRELIQYFVLYNSEKGLHSVLQPIDCKSLDRNTIMRMLLGRDAPPPAPDAVFSARDYLKNVMGRPDTMQMLRPLIARAFADKQRRIFIHIPKTAGSDLTEGLRQFSPALREGDFKAGVSTPEEMYMGLREFAIGIPYADLITFIGHERLTWYQTHDLIRPNDDVFTILRDPVDMVFSFVSYVLTMCEKVRTQPRRDVQIWLRAMGLDEVPEWPSPDARVEFGRRVLRCPGVVAPERTTFYLGDMTAQGALEAAIATNIEITDITRYDAWRQTKFGLGKSEHRHASLPYFARTAASKEDIEYAHDLTGHDRVFYAKAIQALQRSEALSVRGQVLDR
jgi:hypothetical protein